MQVGILRGGHLLRVSEFRGAVRARAGETVLIPGSMGTASCVAEGLGNPEAFATSLVRPVRRLTPLGLVKG